MTPDRRQFCSAVAMGFSTAVPTTVSARSEISITGSISSAAGADIGGVELFFQQVDTGSKWLYTVPDSGDIDFTVTETGTHRIRLINTSSRNTNVPLVYSFGQETIEESGNSVEFTVPDADTVQIQCVDEAGGPVAGLPITLRAGGTGRPDVFTTSQQGYVRFIGTSTTDLQLAGPTEVEVQATNTTDRQPLGTVGVTEPTEYELTVENPAAYANVAPQFIEAAPDSGFNYPYYLLNPTGTRSGDVPLLVEPNNTGTATNDFTTHREAARATAVNRNANQIAQELGVPLLVPVFPRPDGEPVDYTYYTHQLDQDTLELSKTALERIDLQLLNMVEHAKSEVLSDSEYSFTDEIMLNGFSASGNFVDRFTMLHSDRVQSVTAGGLNGMALLPLETADGHTLDYHVGIADIPEITGSSVDLKALDDVDQFLYMGGEDTNDTIPFLDAWTSEELKQTALDVYGEDMITGRFPTSQDAYNQAGVQAQFRIYEGLGHKPAKTNDLIEFHRRSLTGEDVDIFGQTDVSNYDGDVQLSDTTITPETVDPSSSTHTLTFTAQNISADGSPDTFSITIPGSVMLEKINSVTTAPSSDVTPTQDGDTIEFEINPEIPLSPIDITVTAEVVLSSAE